MSTWTAGRGCCSRLRALRRAALLPGAPQPPTRRVTSANTTQAREIERLDRWRTSEIVESSGSWDVCGLGRLRRKRAVENPPPFPLFGSLPVCDTVGASRARYHADAPRRFARVVRRVRFTAKPAVSTRAPLVACVRHSKAWPY